MEWVEWEDIPEDGEAVGLKRMVVNWFEEEEKEIITRGKR